MSDNKPKTVIPPNRGPGGPHPAEVNEHLGLAYQLCNRLIDAAERRGDQAGADAWLAARHAIEAAEKAMRGAREKQTWRTVAGERVESKSRTFTPEDPCLAHTFVGDVCRDCGLVAPRVDVAEKPAEEKMIYDQFPSEHSIRAAGVFDGKRVYVCACGVAGSFVTLTNSNHEQLRLTWSQLGDR